MAFNEVRWMGGSDQIRLEQRVPSAQPPYVCRCQRRSQTRAACVISDPWFPLPKPAIPQSRVSV